MAFNAVAKEGLLGDFQTEAVGWSPRLLPFRKAGPGGCSNLEYRGQRYYKEKGALKSLTIFKIMAEQQ